MWPPLCHFLLQIWKETQLRPGIWNDSQFSLQSERTESWRIFESNSTGSLLSSTDGSTIQEYRPVLARRLVFCHSSFLLILKCKNFGRESLVPVRHCLTCLNFCQNRKLHWQSRRSTTLPCKSFQSVFWHDLEQYNKSLPLQHFLVAALKDNQHGPWPKEVKITGATSQIGR